MKNKSKKVYIVTSGEYSDYCVEGIFSTKEKAKDLKKVVDGNNPIKEYELDKPIYGWMFAVRIEMDIEGNTTHSSYLKQRVNMRFDKYFYNGYLHIDIKSDSLERAIKVVNEKRIQILANNEWGNDKALDKYF